MRLLIVISVLALATATVAVLGVRGQKSTRPPLQGFWDMIDQHKYKAQAESEFFADGRAMRMPPANVVPWGSDTAAADDSLVVVDADFYSLTAFPRSVGGEVITLDKALLNRGQGLFDIHCAVCHGYSGSGNGITSQYGQIVPSYHTDKVKQMPVGEIYRIITDGRGQMPGYGVTIRPADRFAVIAYQRALQVAKMMEQR